MYNGLYIRDIRVSSYRADLNKLLIEWVVIVTLHGNTVHIF